MGCSSEGGFCEGITPYNCTLNVTSGCFYRTNLPSCPESCYGGECVSVSLIDSCTEITAPGSYLLSQDITNNSIIWACIKILSSGVTLDCNNKFILSSSSATGIYANQSTTIKNCNISVGANSPGYGIEVYRASGVIIEGNVLNDQYSGIYLLESNNSQIRNNVIKYNTNKGIHLSSGFNNTIKDNLISSGEFYGILLTISSGNLIINNTIDSNGWYGILVEASLDNSPDGENNITNNTILNSRTGVYVKTSRNRITWNLIDNSTLYHGLYIYGGNSTTIHGNTLTNSAQYGLRIRNSNENIISNNVIRFNGQQGLELSGNSLGNVFSTNVICSNSPDVTCASNQVFSDNYCDSGLVCGGTCNVCSLFSGFAIANFTGDLINSGQRHRIPLIIALVLTIILTLVIILIINSKKKVTNSRYRKY
jgi:parallel beta-helix repeat protein